MFTSKLRNIIATALVVAALGGACAPAPTATSAQPESLLPAHEDGNAQTTGDGPMPPADDEPATSDPEAVEPAGVATDDPVEPPEVATDDSVENVPSDAPAAEPEALVIEKTVAGPGPRLDGVPTDVANMVHAASFAQDELALDMYTYGHVAYLTVTYNPEVLADGGDLTVDFGDGTSESLLGWGTDADDDPLTLDFGDGLVNEISDDPSGSTATGEREEWILTHAYPMTLIPVERQVTVRLGDTFQAARSFTTQVVYTLEFSPLTVTSINSCDTFGKGDFRVRWDQGPNDGNVEGEPWAEASFKLDAGESHTIEEFRYTRHHVTAERLWRDTLAMIIAELDPSGAILAAPWKWDGYQFRGGPSRNDAVVVQQYGDHSYQIVQASNEDEGLPGDDDCVAEWSFTVTLDMYEG